MRPFLSIMDHFGSVVKPDTLSCQTVDCAVCQFRQYYFREQMILEHMHHPEPVPPSTRRSRLIWSICDYHFVIGSRREILTILSFTFSASYQHAADTHWRPWATDHLYWMGTQKPRIINYEARDEPATAQRTWRRRCVSSTDRISQWAVSGAYCYCVYCDTVINSTESPCFVGI